MLVGRNDSALAGTVHLDGAYVGGTVRPENRKEDHVDRRLTENQNPDKRCLLVMRPTYRREETERNGFSGAERTLTFIMKKENQADIGRLALRRRIGRRRPSSGRSAGAVRHVTA